MLDSAMISILKKQVCFLGTSHDNVPRVRPMRPFVSEEGTVWLISYTDTEKTREIEANNTVELCAVDENSNVLRLQGKLAGDEKLPLKLLKSYQALRTFLLDIPIRVWRFLNLRLKISSFVAWRMLCALNFIFASKRRSCLL